MGSLKPWNNFDWNHFVELNKMSKTFKTRHLPVSNHESWRHCKVVTVPNEWKNPVKSKTIKKKSTPSPKPITVFDSSDEEAEASAGSPSAPADPSDEEAEASAASASAQVDPSETEEELNENGAESSDHGDDDDGPESPSSIKRTRSRKTPAPRNVPARRKRKMTARKSQNDSPRKVLRRSPRKKTGIQNA